MKRFRLPFTVCVIKEKFCQMIKTLTKNVVLKELLNNLDIIPLCFQWSTNNVDSCHQTQVHIFVCSMQATFPAELIKAGGGRTIWSEIYKLINSIWNKEELPEEWNESIIVLIYKKGNKTDCSNNGGVSLLSTAYNILSNVWLSRLTPYARKLLGIISVDFDAQVNNWSFILHSSSTWEEMGIQWSGVSAIL